MCKISSYTSHINSFIMAALSLLYLAAIYNCYNGFVHWWEIFLLLFCILEAQYHTIKTHDLAYTMKFWKGAELEIF
jgi:hypothetical protein